MSEIPLEGQRWIVPPQLQGARLDVALAFLWPGCSRTRAKRLVEAGHVRVDGGVERSAKRPLQTGQAVEASPPSSSADVSRAGGPLRVLFEDDWLAVIDKPAGLRAHAEPDQDSVAFRALQRFGPLPALQGADRPGIVHRLDQGTSGVMLLAKNEASLGDLMDQFRERSVEKCYVALTFGEPRFDTGWIELPLRRQEPGSLRQVPAPEGAGREASTYYEVRERLGRAALVHCAPRTGRTHQVRAHLAALGHPLLGDALYRKRGTRAGRTFDGAPPLERHALHAQSLAFVHPRDRTPLCFEAPLAQDLQCMLEWLRRGA